MLKLLVLSLLLINSCTWATSEIKSYTYGLEHTGFYKYINKEFKITSILYRPPDPGDKLFINYSRFELTISGISPYVELVVFKENRVATAYYKNMFRWDNEFMYAKIYCYVLKSKFSDLNNEERNRLDKLFNYLKRYKQSNRGTQEKIKEKSIKDF